MNHVRGMLLIGFLALPTGAAAQEIPPPRHFAELDGPVFHERSPESRVPAATVGALAMEPRYPLLGMLFGAVGGGVVAAMKLSTSDGPVPYPALAFWYGSAGALTGLVVGLYIGAKAEQ